MKIDYTFALAVEAALFATAIIGQVVCPFGTIATIGLVAGLFVGLAMAVVDVIAQLTNKD